jgi:hypothetical protein
MLAVDKNNQPLGIGDMVKVSNRDWIICEFIEDPQGIERPIVKLKPAPDGFIYRHDNEVELLASQKIVKTFGID